jgi:N-acyl-L-homoserine lactone synthetase
MQVTTLSFGNMHNHGELFSNMFRARHETFIQQNKWDLPEADGMEYDQYDTPASRWIAVHEFGHVLAGVRLTPTTARCGIYSYMIRDAQRGLLDSIPSTFSTTKRRSPRTSGNPRASSSLTGCPRTSGCGCS